MTDPFRLTVVSAGLRSPSSTRLLADQLTAAVEHAYASTDATAPLAVEVIELRDHAHEIADALLSGFSSGALRDAVAAVSATDALILVTPTFQGSYSGLFKSFMDLIEADTLRGVPVLPAATGGTPRHSLVIEHAIRPLIAHLGALSTPTGVYAATGDFGDSGLTERIEQAAGELVRLAGAGGSSRRSLPGEEFSATPDFEQLLAGLDIPPGR